ncbi:MAG: class I adenylate-forming enzyme family protein [Solirubrobacterales bacterium]
MRSDYSYPLRVAADRHPRRVAFAYGEDRWTYRDFDRATDRLAGAFEARGLGGRSVLLLLQNEPRTVMVYLALARAGAIAVPVNPKLLPHEIAFVADDCGAAAVVADAPFLETAAAVVAECPGVERVLTVNAAPGGADERIEDLGEEGDRVVTATVDPDSVALIVYTSGTSGVPKGVARTHDANIWATVNSGLGQARHAEDVEVFVLPLFGIAFIFQVMPMLLAGGTVVLDGAFDPARTWELLEAHRATRVFLAPTMIDSMLAIAGQELRDVSSLHTLNTAYEFPERVRTAAARRFGDIIAYMYGLTEAQLCCSTAAEFVADPTNAGLPMGMMRVRVVDEEGRPVDPGVVGEVILDGPSVMSGYHQRPEATAEALQDGWLHTGDLGYLDEAGRVHIVGRKKAMIKSGGFSVDPVEVENAILDFDGVREAAVVGVADEHWGEQVVAFAAPAAGLDGAEAEVLAFVKSKVASYKCPKRLLLLPELPKNAMGKIERARLRELAESSGQPA